MLNKSNQNFWKNLKKFCGDQQTHEEAMVAAKAFDDERLIALNKKRNAYSHNDLSIEYAHLVIDESESTFREALSESSGPFIDSPARVGSGSGATLLPPTGAKEACTNTNSKSGRVIEWLSICLEGCEEQIKNFFAIL